MLGFGTKVYKFIFTENKAGRALSLEYEYA